MANTTWGSMLKAPGNIASGIGSGIMKAVKYTIYGAVVCGLAVGLNQFAHDAFGIENYASKITEYVGSTFGWAVEGIVNSVGKFFNLSPALITPGTIGEFVGSASTADDAATGAIKTIEGWATGIGNKVGEFFTKADAVEGTLEANQTIAHAALAVGGTAAVAGKTVGKWQAAEDQRRASRAQALQQLG